MSPKFYGFTVGGSYSFGGVAGATNRGSTWSAAIQYLNGPAGIAVGYQRINNATLGGGVWRELDRAKRSGHERQRCGTGRVVDQRRLQDGTVATASRRDGRLPVHAGVDISVSYSNVQYIPGTLSAFRNTAIFTAGAVLHWKASPQWDFAAGYSYTAATQSNGVSSRPSTIRSRCRSTTACRSARVCTRLKRTSTLAAIRSAALPAASSMQRRRSATAWAQVRSRTRSASASA